MCSPQDISIFKERLSNLGNMSGQAWGGESETGSLIQVPALSGQHLTLSTPHLPGMILLMQDAAHYTDKEAEAEQRQEAFPENT